MKRHCYALTVQTSSESKEALIHRFNSRTELGRFFVNNLEDKTLRLIYADHSLVRHAKKLAGKDGSWPVRFQVY